MDIEKRSDVIETEVKDIKAQVYGETERCYR